MKEKSIFSNQTFIVSTLLLALAVAFVTFYSFSTSPLFNNYEYVDSSIYKVIGRGWVDGLVPYVDLWDQKGPLIYFINAVGYWIAGSDIGVWLLQCGFAFVSLLLAYRFFRTSMSTSMSIMFVLLVMVSLIQTYNCGNNVEEYNIPFLMASLFGAYSWADKVQTSGEVDHSPWLAAIYGITFAVAAAMRLTNALGVAFAMLVIIFMLIRHGRWKNLLSNALWFVGAFVAGLLPFVIYYAAKNALPDLWFGAIGFNLNYAQASNIPTTIVGWIKRILININGYLTIFFGIVLILCTKRKLIGAMFVLSPLPLVLWIVYSLGYWHYSMLLLPYLCLLIREGYLLYKTSSKKLSRHALLFVCMLLVLFHCATGARITADVPSKNNEAKAIFDTYGDLIKRIPNWGKEDIVLYSTHPETYIIYGITPRHKFFNAGDFLADVSPRYRQMLLEEYNTNPPKWLICKTKKSGKFPGYIRPIVEKKYTPVSQQGEATLFCLNSDQ